MRLDFFVFLDPPAAKNPFYFLHQKVFEKNTKGLPCFLCMERIERLQMLPHRGNGGPYPRRQIVLHASNNVSRMLTQ